MNGNEDSSISIRIAFPLPDEKIFSSESVSEILELLINNPHQEFSISQIQRVIERGSSSTNKGIDILEALDLIKIRKKGKKYLISINREKIKKPDDPIFSISQESFRDPIREFKQEILDKVDYVAGIIVFGSVARGEADRASDIDMMIIVEDDITSARRKITDIVSQMENRKIENERYEFEAMVESPDSIKKRGKKVRNIFSEGIVLHKTKALDEVKEVVFNDK